MCTFGEGAGGGGDHSNAVLHEGQEVLTVYFLHVILGLCILQDLVLLR